MTTPTLPWTGRIQARGEALPYWLELAKLADEPPKGHAIDQRIFEQLQKLGTFRTVIPQDLGGDEAGPLEAVRLVEEFASLSGTIGWLSFVGVTGGMFSVELPPDGAGEVYADPNVLVAYAGGINGLLTPRGDDYSMSGSWPLASGLSHASWIAVGCRVADEDVTAVALLPAADCHTSLNWSPVGLSGTGTGRLEVSDVLVPSARIAHDTRTDSNHRRRRRYRVLIPSAMASVAVGISGAAVDHAARAIAQEPDRPPATRRRDSHQVQDLLGRSYARLLASRSLLHEVTAEAWEKASSGDELGLELGARHRLAATHAAHVAAEVTADVAGLLGVRAVTEGDPATRRWLDARMVSANITVRDLYYRVYGGVATGGEIPKSWP
jgi:alkylation response protein AidB-like acyl-CoA dehydrogenase